MGCPVKNHLPAKRVQAGGPRLTVMLYTVAMRDKAPRGCYALLSAEDRQRLLAITAPAPALRFITMRATLRLVLGKMLDIDPKAVPLLASERGKPYLAGNSLFFSVSYRAGIGLIAVAERELGVDVELVENAAHIATASALTFAADERAAIEHYTNKRRRELLLQGWTRKESIVKAMGTGMSHPLHEIRTAPGAKEAVNEFAGRRWVTRDLPARGKPWRAALTVDLPAGMTMRVSNSRVPEPSR